MSVDYFLRIVQKARHKEFGNITVEEVNNSIKEFDIEIMCLNAKADLIKENQKILMNILREKAENDNSNI